MINVLYSFERGSELEYNCNFSGIRLVPPFSVSFIVSYIFKVYKSSGSYASLVMTHAAR